MKTIKKIISLGMGAVMIGATLVGASSLNTYPEPFIKDGTFNGVLVVGDDAAASDVVGVSDIAMSMQYAASVKAGIDSASTIKIEGDAFEFKKGSDKLEYGEDLIDTISTLDNEDLNALGDGIFRGKTTEEYSQTIKVGEDASTVFEVYDEADEDPAMYLKFPAGKTAMEYSLKFGSSVKSDVDDDMLEDFEDNMITILGKEYTVTKAEKIDNAGNIKMTFMSGTVQDTMEVGQTKTYTIEGKEYEVSVMVVSGDEPDTAVTKLIVNDEVTKSLAAGDTYKLKDGTDLGIKEVLPTKSGDLIQNLVEFYLGAEKLVMQNDRLDIGNDANIADVDVDISTTMSGDEIRLNSIDIEWSPSNSLYVPIGGTLLDAVEMEEEEDAILFLEKLGVNYEFRGITADGSADEIVLEGDSDDALQMTFTNSNDEEYQFPIFFRNGVVRFGEEAGKQLYMVEGDTVCDDESFIVENDEITRVLKLTQVKDGEYIKLKDIGTGDTNEYSLDGNESTINLDDYDYKIDITGMPDDCISLVDITDDGDGKADIYTKYGSKFELVNGTGDANIIFGESEDMVAEYRINVTNADPIDFIGDFTGIEMLDLDSDNDISRGVSRYGTAFERDTDGDQDVWTINVPEDQMEVDVYFTAGTTSIETIEIDESEVVIMNKIDVGAVKLASEISGYEKSENILLVGGPCINDAVIEVSDEFPTCANWPLEPGEALIQMVEQDSGAVALLVAGTTAADTRAVTKLVAEGIKLKGLAEGAMKQVLDVSTGELAEYVEIGVNVTDEE